MAEAIIFGDVEDAVRIYLDAALAVLGDSAVVAVTVPNPRPARLVLTPRLGGPRRDLVTDSPMLGIECWDDKPSTALELVQLVRGLINALKGQTISGLTVYRVQETAGPGLLPDPDSDQARYVYTVVLDVRYLRIVDTDGSS